MRPERWNQRSLSAVMCKDRKVNANSIKKQINVSSTKIKGRALTVRTCAFAFVLQTVTLSLTFAMFSGLYAQAWYLPCPLLFHGLTGLAERVFTGSCNWYSYKPQVKNSFSAIHGLDSLSKFRSHQLQL